MVYRIGNSRQECVITLFIPASQDSLEEEAAHLRAQVVALKASADQAAVAAAAAAAVAQSAAELGDHRDSSAAAARDHAAKVMQLQTALQQERHEKDMQQSSMVDLQRR